MNVTIEEMRAGDWKQVRSIYLEGIATGNATFETSAPAWEKWDGGHLADCRLVVRSDEEMLGWAALNHQKTFR
ncbi:MAG: GNAT family N-acetyltransferase [Pyrinomonadaceae bacterium]